MPLISLRRLLVTVAAAVALTAFGVLPDRAHAVPGDATCDTAAFASGDGSVGNPFRVASRAALDEVRDCVDKNFLQTSAIDLGGVEWTPIGPIPPTLYFAGTYDGGNYAITGLSITTPPSGYVGLFGFNYGTIRNVVLSGSISFTNCANVAGVGGLAGANLYSIATSTVNVTVNTPNCDVVGGAVGVQPEAVGMDAVASFGNVIGRDKVGGLVGQNFASPIRRSLARGSVSGSSEVGGLIGKDFGSTTIEDSYARGSVTATSTPSGVAGGLIGEATGFELILRRTYATGAVTGAVRGGLVGKSSVTTHTAAGNFWDVTTTGVATDSVPTGTTGRVSTALRLLANYTDASWDIDTTGTKVWQICQGANDEYPFLSWEQQVPSGCTATEPPPPVLPPTGAGWPLTMALVGVGLMVLGMAVSALSRRHRGRGAFLRRSVPLATLARPV